jgi:hypothetical protein
MGQVAHVSSTRRAIMWGISIMLRHGSLSCTGSEVCGLEQQRRQAYRHGLERARAAPVGPAAELHCESGKRGACSTARTSTRAIVDSASRVDVSWPLVQHAGGRSPLSRRRESASMQRQRGRTAAALRHGDISLTEQSRGSHRVAPAHPASRWAACQPPLGPLHGELGHRVTRGSRTFPHTVPSIPGKVIDPATYFTHENVKSVCGVT